MLSYFFSSFLHFVSIFSILFSQVDFKKKRYFLLGHISRFANNVKKNITWECIIQQYTNTKPE